MNKLYTAQEVADRLKIKKTTVYELIKRNELESSKIGKQIRISEEQLNRYLKGNSTAEEESPLRFPDFQPESSLLKRDYLLHSNGLIISGQASPALDLLINQMALYPDALPVLQSHQNTYNGLYSLYFGKVHAAVAALAPEQIPALIPGVPLAALYLYEYAIGFYIKKGNPKNLNSIRDLTRADVILANREKGSTSRIWLDENLKKSGIAADSVSGYKKEMVSDLSTAEAVISGRADIAVGGETSAAQSGHLDFLPMAKLPMFLVMEKETLQKPGFSVLADIVRSDEFRTSLRSQSGYDTGRTGEILYL